MSLRRRSLAAGLGLALLAPFVGPGGAGAVPPPTPVDRAVGFVLDNQQDDGSFEVAGFPGFETPDAIFALASFAQADPAWDPQGAFTLLGSIPSPFPYIDDLVDDGDTTTVAAAARAAKVLALVGNPLGFAATDFDPANDSPGPVDLVARINAFRRPDGSYAFGAQFNAVLYTAIALEGAGQPVPAGLIVQIRNAQRADGSWNYLGDQDPGTSGDVDTSSLALIALRSNGLGVADADVRDGVEFLAAAQNPSGAWPSFGADDPNSTSLAAVALSDLHVDVTVGAWRSQYGSPLPAGEAYVSPYAWLLSQQAPDGHIASGNDAFGLNTFATSQSIQALARQWYLAEDHENLVNELARRLGSPAASPSTAAAPLASGFLGPNASTRSARVRSAAFVLSSQFGLEAAAADLFQQALGRPIDPSGRAYWSNQLKTITRSQMLSRLTASTEFYRRAGSTTPGFVDAVYQAVLGRAADPSGRAYWIRRIDGGDARLHMAQSFVAGTEYRRKTVDAAYQRALDRPADPSGRTYWTNRLATTRVEVLLAELGGSGEFYENAQAVGG